MDTNNKLNAKVGPRGRALDPVHRHMDTYALRVLELYNAKAQGEGMWYGIPSTFLRLAGCTVGCYFCDTKYSWLAQPRNNSEDLTPEEISIRVGALMTHNHLVLTGGEPLEHDHDLVALTLQKILLEHDSNITIETSGVYDPTYIGDELRVVLDKSYGRQVLWSVAPKLSMAKSRYEFPDLNPFLNQNWKGNSLQFKFVVENPDDIKEAMEHLERTRDHATWDEPNPPWIIIQPCSPGGMEKTDINVVREQILSLTERVQHWVDTSKACQVWSYRKIPILVRPQIHTLIYGNRKGV